MKLLVLGCGNVGANVAIGLASTMPDVHLTVADINLELAAKVAQRIGRAAKPVQIDIFNWDALYNLISGHDIVFNACGPHYKTGIYVIETAIKAGVNYVDINDDHDVAKEVFTNRKYNDEAIKNNCIVLIGCGGTPGFTNVLAKYAADQLDATDSIRICWIVPYLPKFFSPAVIDHLFHMLTGKVAQYLDGKLVDVSPYGGVRDVEFLKPFGTYPAYFSGHAEPVTLSRYVKGVREVTIRSFFFPRQIDEVIRHLVTLGFSDRNNIGRTNQSPVKFISELFLSSAFASKFFEEADIEPFGWATQIEVCGRRGAEAVRVIYEDHSFFDKSDKALSENDIGETIDPTGICARLVLEEFIKGNIPNKGVWAPEGCLSPYPYIDNVIRESKKKIYRKEEVITELTSGAGAGIPA